MTKSRWKFSLTLGLLIAGSCFYVAMVRSDFNGDGEVNLLNLESFWGSVSSESLNPTIGIDQNGIPYLFYGEPINVLLRGS